MAPTSCLHKDIKLLNLHVNIMKKELNTAHAPLQYESHDVRDLQDTVTCTNGQHNDEINV